MTKVHQKVLKANHLMTIASYLLVFAILSNLIYIPCYFYIRQINRTNVIEHYEHKLSSGMQLLDSSMESFLSFGILISQSPAYRELCYYNSTPNATLLSEIRAAMSSSLTAPYSFIGNFGLTQGDNILFSRNHIYYDRELLSYDHYFSCSDAEYLDKFNDAYCILPASHFSMKPEGEYDAVTLGYRCSKINDIYLFLHYPKEQLQALFVNEETLESNYIAIYNGDKLLCSGGTKNVLVSSEHDAVPLSISSNTGLDIRVELLLSDRYIEQDLAGFKHLVHIFLSIIALTTCLWVLIFSWRLTIPFNQISAALYEAGYWSENHPRKNSIHTLVDRIRYMGLKLSDYSQLIEEQKQQNRIHILEKALYKGLYDPESIAAFTEAFPDFPDTWQLALIQYTSDEALILPDNIQFLVTQYFQQVLPEVILIPHNQDSLLAFFPVNDSSCPAEELEDMQTCLQEQQPIFISSSISGTYDHYNLLPDALWELEYNTASLQYTASPYNSRENLPISIQQIQTIYLSLQNGDEQAALMALKNGTESFLSNNSGDFAIAKYSYQMIVHVLVRIKLEHDNLIDIAIPNLKHSNVRALFETELPACFSQIAARFNQQRAAQIQDLDYKLLAFINENIANQQLCISMVTDHFHISAPTLQKRMNFCVSKTFSAYVEDIRMKKAHQLVLETNLTNNEIAETVGYTNANSFYKAYKRYWGKAPRSARQSSDD